MSGHSKWATTKHKKAALDSKRGKLFAKLIKNIEVAAKLGGADPNGNPTLFDAVQKAKKSSVPIDNINRAVKRGAGLNGDGVDYMSLIYEGYAPGGIAIIIECLTDNKNRAASEIRTALSKNNGQLADPGSVSYNFARKGVVIVPADGTTEEAVFKAVLDAGVEEVNEIVGSDAEGDSQLQFEIMVEPNSLVSVREALQAAKIDYNSADVVFYPAAQVEVDEVIAQKVLRVLDVLEDLDDVQNVYSNMA
ncbi:MAG: YebC/PmpR family DNA-binding transcriptional regulator [Candidatus Ancillula trichonymphae]|jgi:YebC/PmpR family DNA-binding regulatory protein|nr:YebC/PmpR family DNA-binding transcriptional regulator [Candidatus Ancillula trichonymphae]